MMGSRKWLHTRIVFLKTGQGKQLEPIKIMEEEKPKRELYHLVQSKFLTTNHCTFYTTNHLLTMQWPGQNKSNNSGLGFCISEFLLAY